MLIILTKIFLYNIPDSLSLLSTFDFFAADALSSEILLFNGEVLNTMLVKNYRHINLHTIFSLLEMVNDIL